MSVSTEENPNRVQSSLSVLRAENLNKSYGEDCVLGGVDLELLAGERVAIMGPSGSGKSTLLHCLSGILPVDSGRIFLGDQDVSSLNEDEWSELRSHAMAFIFQFFQLLPTLTVQENVEFPLLLQRLPKDVRQDRVSALLKEVGLEPRRTAFPGTLSGGEQQRVAIARALVAAPKLLFADEPTGSLDARNGQAILDLLQVLSERTQTTILMATHDRHAASRCDRVFRLVDGQLIPDTVA